MIRQESLPVNLNPFEYISQLGLKRRKTEINYQQIPAGGKKKKKECFYDSSAGLTARYQPQPGPPPRPPRPPCLHKAPHANSDRICHIVKRGNEQPLPRVPGLHSCQRGHPGPGCHGAETPVKKGKIDRLQPLRCFPSPLSDQVLADRRVIAAIGGNNRLLIGCFC